MLSEKNSQSATEPTVNQESPAELPLMLNTISQPALTDNRKIANQFAPNPWPLDALKLPPPTGHQSTDSRANTPTSENEKDTFTVFKTLS